MQEMFSIDSSIPWIHEVVEVDIIGDDAEQQEKTNINRSFIKAKGWKTFETLGHVGRKISMERIPTGVSFIQH